MIVVALIEEMYQDLELRVGRLPSTSTTAVNAEACESVTQPFVRKCWDIQGDIAPRITIFFTNYIVSYILVVEERGKDIIMMKIHTGSAVTAVE